ncbi:MAG: succinate dehydrogenase (quinone) flavoprotein subunit, partial [Bacteroidales bacterium]|nr:succinate dehydrogenase (quinone) flavoprotein subunit [Bacteroidales bacterium]
ERHEMMDLVIKDGRARGIIVRNLVTGELERYAAHAVVLATGGYGNVYYLSTNAMNSNGSAAWVCHRRGAAFANPCYVQIHPTCIPVHGDYQSKLTLMSESLRNDGRIWVPKKKEDAEAIRRGDKGPLDIPEEDRDYYLERRYPAFGNLVPRDVASRAAKERCDAGYGVGPTGLAVYLDFADAIKRLGRNVVEQKYGNLFQMYQKIVDVDPYEYPMMIYPAIHYTMGGIWVDYELSTTIPGLFAAGEANFSDHGANRLGASALMQGLADGYFVLPYTVQEYLADQFNVKRINPAENDAFKKAENDVKEYIQKLMSINGKNSVDHYHKELGKIMWNNVGMARTKESLETAIKEIKALREEFWKNVRIPGKADELNVELEKANRVADFLELGELIARDALHRNESCGGHFREESQEEGEAKRDDENFMYVGAWEYKGYNQEPELHKEPLNYQYIKVQKRNYKTGK